MYMAGDNKPIGWWIKEVDRLLELSFERVLAADGVSRRQWQALNAARGEEPIEVALAPFLAGDPAELAAVTEPLTARGWLDDATRLTPAGATALAALTEKVQAERRRCVPVRHRTSLRWDGPVAGPDRHEREQR